MMRIAILGNSGSGKSTLAHKIALESGAAVLDLDTIYWDPTRVAVRRHDNDVHHDLDHFCNLENWIAEGCYGDLIARTFHWRPQLIFLNPGEEICRANCRDRPWEPHKYPSKAEQDAKLALLLAWVSEYYVRDGDMSYKRHRELFDAYEGPKREITSRDEPL